MNPFPYFDAPFVMRLVLAIACAFGAAACKSSGASPCGNLLCPSGRVCAPALELCVLESQLDGCDGAPRGEPCAFGGITDAECVAEVCIPTTCGDGIRTTDEVCDDGNNLDGDGCSATCDSTELCGNGVVDLEAGENCDCGTDAGTLPEACVMPNSNAPGSRCLNNCRTPSCGDGLVSASEDCDGEVQTSCSELGFSRGQVTCSPTCRFDTSGCEGFCGDGRVNEPEICDGDAPIRYTCIDFGFDYGSLACGLACFPVTDSCSRIAYPVSANRGEFDAASVWIRDDGVIVVASAEGLFEYADEQWSLAAAGTFSRGRGSDDRGYAVGPGGALLAYDGSWQEIAGTSDELVDVCPFGERALVVGQTSGYELVNGVLQPLLLDPFVGDGLWTNSCAVVGDRHLVSAAGQAWSRSRGNATWETVALPPSAMTVATDGLGNLFAQGPAGFWQLDDASEWRPIDLQPSGVPAAFGHWRDSTAVVLPEKVHLRAASWAGQIEGFAEHGEWRDLSAAGTEEAVVVESGAISGNPRTGVHRLRNNVLLRTDEAAPVVLVGDATYSRAGDVLREFRNGTSETTEPFVNTRLSLRGLWASEDRIVVAGGTDFESEIKDKRATGGWVRRVRYESRLNDLHIPFAVGDDGLIVEEDGTWRTRSVATTEDLLAVWVDEEGSAMAVGRRGTALLFRDGGWSLQPTGVAGDLHDVWKQPGGPWFVVGDNGVVLAFADGQWTEYPSTTGSSLRAVGGSGAGDVFVGGTRGTVLYLQDGRWLPLNVSLSDTIESIAVGQGRVLFATREMSTSVLAPDLEP